MSPCPPIASIQARKVEDDDDDDDDQKHKTSVLHVNDYEQRRRCVRDKRAIAGSCSLTHQYPYWVTQKGPGPNDNLKELGACNEPKIKC